MGKHTLDLQRALKREGFDPGPLDGQRGKQTNQALGEWSEAALSLSKGIDISHYQTKVDWSLLSSKIDFIGIRASVSQSKDKLFEQHWLNAKEAGLLRSAYHFFNPLRDPAKQADLIWSRIESDPGELPITLDVESLGNKEQQVSRDFLVSGVSSCLARLESLSGDKPIFYTYSSFSIQHQLGKYFSAYPLWIADYREGPPTIEGSGWSNYIIHQYAGNGGHQEGVTGPCDLNRCRIGLTELKALR